MRISRQMRVAGGRAAGVGGALYLPQPVDGKAPGVDSQCEDGQRERKLRRDGEKAGGKQEVDKVGKGGEGAVDHQGARNCLLLSKVVGAGAMHRSERRRGGEEERRRKPQPDGCRANTREEI